MRLSFSLGCWRWACSSLAPGSSCGAQVRVSLELIATYQSKTRSYMCTCGSDVDLQVALQPRDHGAARGGAPARDARRLQVHALTLCLAHICTCAFINTCVCVLARYLRHPSYFGWFWWCVGTQCLLCNPLCILAYAVAAWDFFRKRIP